MLDKQGQINAIQVLERNCAANRLAQVRGDIVRVLPDTQVIELSDKALTRAEARKAATAKKEAAFSCARNRTAPRPSRARRRTAPWRPASANSSSPCWRRW